jgi:hypothetical protein
MQGSIRQRSVGSWELRVLTGTDPETGRRCYCSKTVRGSQMAGSRLAGVGLPVGASHKTCRCVERERGAHVRYAVRVERQPALESERGIQAEHRDDRQRKNARYICRPTRPILASAHQLVQPPLARVEPAVAWCRSVTEHGGHVPTQPRTNRDQYDHHHQQRRNRRAAHDGYRVLTDGFSISDTNTQPDLRAIVGSGRIDDRLGLSAVSREVWSASFDHGLDLPMQPPACNHSCAT